MKPFANESKFWLSIWNSQGRPRFGFVYVNMKHAKLQYKYALRRLKKCNDIIQNEKFLKGVLHDGSNFFNEIRKSRGKNRVVSSRIDSEVGSQNIAQHFANTYRELYNNVENGSGLDHLKYTINQGITASSAAQIKRIDERVISSALKKLEPSKKDAIFNTVSDC